MIKKSVLKSCPFYFLNIPGTGPPFPIPMPSPGHHALSMDDTEASSLASLPPLPSPYSSQEEFVKTANLSVCPPWPLDKVPAPVPSAQGLSGSLPCCLSPYHLRSASSRHLQHPGLFHAAFPRLAHCSFRSLPVELLHIPKTDCGCCFLQNAFPYPAVFLLT